MTAFMDITKEELAALELRFDEWMRFADHPAARKIFPERYALRALIHNHRTAEKSFRDHVDTGIKMSHDPFIGPTTDQEK